MRLRNADLMAGSSLDAFYLNAHPYGDGQSDDGQEDREQHQEPTAEADVTVWVLKCWRKKGGL